MVVYVVDLIIIRNVFVIQNQDKIIQEYLKIRTMKNLVNLRTLVLAFGLFSGLVAAQKISTVPATPTRKESVFCCKLCADNGLRNEKLKFKMRKI